MNLGELVVTQTDAQPIDVVHARALGELEQRDFNSAAVDFALCVTAAPNGKRAPSCLFHEGVARDELGQFEAALDRFLQVTRRFADDPLSRAAGFRALRLAVHLERWQIASTLARRALEAKDLRAFERVLPYGALALDATSRGNDLDAEQYVSRARSVIDEHQLDVPGKIHRDLAAVYFALGEVRRLRATRTELVPVSSRFPELLEARCQLILDAQSAYSDAMRSYDAHWSTMAGYRVGELYASLHTEVLRVLDQPPVQGDQPRLLLEGAMRLRYAVLVQKALRMMQQTIEMADRVGESSGWLDKARKAREELRRRVELEEEAIDRLPYTREAMTQALQRLRNDSNRRESRK